MNFTQTEIDLAKLLKEKDCYAWVPQVGDWFLYEIPDIGKTDIIVELRARGDIRGMLYGIDKNLWRFSEKDELVGLPFVHQCIQIITEKGMEVYFDTGLDNEVEVYYLPNKSIVDVQGASLLEAFYKILLLI